MSGSERMVKHEVVKFREKELAVERVSEICELCGVVFVACLMRIR